MFNSIKKLYWKLPGNTLMRTHSLWIGEHHLLYVRSRSFYEDYWHFSFEDIQAITVQKTSIFFLWAAFFGLCAALFIFFSFTTDDFNFQASLVLAGCSLLFFIINLIRGPTCVCYLHTRAQTRKMPSLRRLRKAKKAIHLLKEEINKHQGQSNKGIKE